MIAKTLILSDKKRASPILEPGIYIWLYKTLLHLQDMLDTFIKKFVLCEQCENPETHFKILEKKGIIKSSCAACGHSFQIDMRHKLTTYIIKVRFSDSLF